eukprot:SAG11_NODE_2887_length_2866_cov_17.548247_3_plen_149_part_00
MRRAPMQRQLAVRPGVSASLGGENVGGAAAQRIAPAGAPKVDLHCDVRCRDLVLDDVVRLDFVGVDAHDARVLRTPVSPHVRKNACSRRQAAGRGQPDCGAAARSPAGRWPRQTVAAHRHRGGEALGPGGRHGAAAHGLVGVRVVAKA